MHSHARFTSESSNTTNSSAATEQTYVPGDDTTSNCANISETYPKQAVGYLAERHNETTVGLNDEYELQKQNAQLSMENRFPISKQHQRKPLWMLHSRVNSREPGYIPESSPMLGDSFHESRRSVESLLAEIIKLKKKYKSLRRMFLILAFLCIVLIICVISVLPVILVSFRLENNNGQSRGDDLTSGFSDALKEFLFGQLHTQRAKGIIRNHIFCSKCHERGGNAYGSKSFDDPHESECCQEEIFSEFKTFQDVFSEKLKTHTSNMRKHSGRIDKLETEVITLQHNGGKKRGNNTTPSSPSIFEGSVLQGRMEKLKGKMENNNKLLNHLLGWKRSSMQLKGTVKSDFIEWQEDISNGKIISMSNNKLQVRSGGTYFIYINVQFTKFNCTKHEEFHYVLMKDRGGFESPVARVKHNCMGISNSVDFTLNLQKVVKVQLDETASFYFNASYALSHDPWAHHVFGIIEV